MFLNGEKQTVLTTLVSLAASEANPGHFLRALTPSELRPDLPASAGATADFAERVLDLCCRGGPPCVLVLLDYMIDDRGRPGLDEIRTRLRVPQPVTAHPIEAEIIRGGFPFADRQQLRQALRQMISPTADRPILHISGDPGSGKSWTYQLLDHWSREVDGHVLCLFEVDENSGVDAGPAEVAKDLVSQLGGDTGDVPQMANEEAYANDLAQWVIRHANDIETDPGARVWFVFDGFGKEELRPDTAKFLLALAVLCTKGINARRHRVVFCELYHQLNSRMRMSVATYQTEPLTRDHIRAVISAAVEMRRDLAPGDIPILTEAITDKVIDGAPEPFANLHDIGARLELQIAETVL